MNKNLGIFLVAVVVAAAVAGGYYFPRFNGLTASSTAGSTFNTPKFYGVAVNLANPGANGTSTSLTNNDGNDRYITGYRLGCQNVGSSKTAYTGAGLVNLLLSIGTTTTSAPAIFSSNIPAVNAVTVSTSTVNSSVASTTSQLGNGGLWRSGEILTFSFNATNTAACTVGVDAVAA